MILQLDEVFFVELGQRGSRNIEAHMNRRRDFIDVLPAGTLRTHSMDVDFCIRDRHVRRDVQHQKISGTDLYFALKSKLCRPENKSVPFIS